MAKTAGNSCCPPLSAFLFAIDGKKANSSSESGGEPGGAVFGDRSTLFPKKLREPIQEHLKRVKELHEKDLVEGHGHVYLPDAVSRKYPKADEEWGWQ